MSTVETNLVQPSTGTTLTLGASGDTVTIPSGATIDASAGTATGFGVADGGVTVAKLSTSATEADNVKKRVAKAWVNFSGTGTPAIQEDFNFTSITDNGTGDYTLSFTANMSSANYVAVGTVCASSRGVVSITATAAGTVQVITREGHTGTITDYGETSVLVFGDLA